MGCKWRLLFLISPEVFSSTYFPIENLIFSLILSCFVLSTASFPTLSNIEWNIHLLASSLNLMNRNFLPLSTNSLNTLITKLSNFSKSKIDISGINSQDLWNGLIQSLYSPSWDPAEILSPVKRTFKCFNSRKCILILGSFPSSLEEINSFFTTNKNCFEIKQLSSLFLREVLPPDLNKSLSSKCIHLIWINTNPNLSSISIALQKSIKQIQFFCVRCFYPTHNSNPLLPCLQLNDFKTFFPVVTTNTTYHPCTLQLFDSLLSIQAKVKPFDSISFMLSDDICHQFLSKLYCNVSLNFTYNKFFVLFIRVLACLRSPIIDVLNLFNFEQFSFITCPQILQITDFNYNFLILISNADGFSSLACLTIFSDCIAYFSMIAEKSFVVPKLIFLEMMPIITRSDFIVSPTSDEVDFVNNFQLKEFIYFLLSPVYSFGDTLFNPILPTSSTLQGDSDLLDWIENDLIVGQNTALRKLYLKTRPCPCDPILQLVQLRSSMYTLNIESVKSEATNIVINSSNDRIDACCKTLSDLINTIHDAEEFSDKVYSLLVSINAKDVFKEIGGFLYKRLISNYGLLTLQQIKQENSSIDQRSTLIKKQVVIRFLLFPSFHIYETNTKSHEFISEVVSFLRYLTISTSPAFVTDFMLNSLVKNCDLTLEPHKEFLRELYESLGNQPPEVLADSSLLYLSRDSIPDLSPVFPSSNCQLPSTPNERDNKFIRYQSFHRLFADNSREISVVNRNISLSNTVEIPCNQQRNFKRTLFATEPKSDTHKRTDRNSIRNGSRSAGNPSKKVKILCEETPLKNRSSNRLLNIIRSEQKKSGFSPTETSVVLESPQSQRVFYSESSTLSWRHIPNDLSNMTPEKNISILSVFHSPLLAYRSVPFQHLESPFKLPFDCQSNHCISPVLEQKHDGFIYNSTPIVHSIQSPTINSNCKMDMFVTPTKYSS